MHTSLQLIDLAKQRLALKNDLTLPMTDYRLAKLMEIRPQTLSQWRTGRTTIGTEFVRKFSEACELSEAYVYACIEHDRAPAEVRGVLEQIAAAFAGKAASLVMAIVAAGTLFALSPNHAHAAHSSRAENIHYT